MTSYESAIFPIAVDCVKKIVSFMQQAAEVDKNVEQLQKDLPTLKEKARRVQEKVYADEAKRDQAALWMFQVAQLHKEAMELVDGYSRMDLWHLFGIYPRRGCIRSRYRTSGKAKEHHNTAMGLLDNIPNVSSLKDRISEVAMAPNPVGIDSMVENLKNFVKGSSMIMGIFGMSGVGKATLVKKLNNDLYDDFRNYVNQGNFLSGQNLLEAQSDVGKGELLLSPKDHFDVVIFFGEETTTSEKRMQQRIQQGIAKRLGLAWESEEETSMADAISKALRSMKFLIIMVDLYYNLDIQYLGIPNNGRSGSKLIFTMQKEPVFNQICSAFSDKGDNMHLRCLKRQPAREFFMKKLQGVNNTECILGTNERHTEEIIKRCGGLPIALEAIANRMKSKKNDVNEWSATLCFLETKPKQIGELETVIQKLRRPYDHLNKLDGSKTCFFYCALFPGKRGIKRDWLVQYWIGERLTKYSDPQLRDLITNLTEASLLERVCPKDVDHDDDDDDDGNDGSRERDNSHMDDDSHEEGGNKSDNNDDDDERYTIGGAGGDDDEDNVKMHSMYRVLAISIPKQNRFVVRTHGDEDLPEDGDWKTVGRVSLMTNDLNRKLGKITQCEKLKTLVLNGNALHDIPPKIFCNMSHLKVLDLSSTAIEELPSEIKCLKKLVCLNLYKSKLKKLPEELKRLKELRFLNLGYTTRLEEIPHNVISSLENLRMLIMYASYGAWDVDSSGDGVKLEELEKLTVLEELAITVEKEKVLKTLYKTPRLAEITSRLLIRGCQDMHSFQLPHLVMSRLRLGRVVDCGDLKLLEIGNPSKKWRTGGTQERKLELKGLPMANIKWRGNLSQNMWLQSLTWLSITSCNGIQGQLIGISTEKNDEQKEKIKIFGALRYLELNDLPGLDGIYDCLLPFASLRTFKVLRCPKLKRLPFTQDGAKNLRHFYCEKGWWDELQGQGENLCTRLKDLVKFE